MANKRDRIEVLLEAGIGAEEAARLAGVIRRRMDEGVDPGEPFTEAEVEAMAGLSEEDVLAAMAGWYAERAPE